MNPFTETIAPAGVRKRKRSADFRPLKSAHDQEAWIIRPASGHCTFKRAKVRAPFALPATAPAAFQPQRGCGTKPRVASIRREATLGKRPKTISNLEEVVSIMQTQQPGI